jgi:hypothetical protein
MNINALAMTAVAIIFIHSSASAAEPAPHITTP